MATAVDDTPACTHFRWARFSVRLPKALYKNYKNCKFTVGLQTAREASRLHKNTSKLKRLLKSLDYEFLHNKQNSERVPSAVYTKPPNLTKCCKLGTSYLTQIAEKAGDIVGLVMQRQMIVKFQGGTQYQITAGKRARDLHRGSG
jgi:hypothetical protein